MLLSAVGCAFFFVFFFFFFFFFWEVGWWGWLPSADWRLQFDAPNARQTQS